MFQIRAERPSKTFDAPVCHVWHVKDGKATEFWALVTDQYAADEFWS